MKHRTLIIAVGESAQPWGAISVYLYLKQQGEDVGFIHLFGGLRELDTVEEPPEFVGLSVYTTVATQALRTARHIRQRWPQVKIVVGGRHICRDILDRDGKEWEAVAGFLVTGDGEYAMLDIVRGAALPGVITGRWFTAEDLAQLPLPGRDFILKNYPYPRRDELLFSRGCPYRCTFCGSDRPRIIHVDPERAARYLADWAEWHGRLPIFIMDDVFTARREWLVAFADAYTRCAGHIPIRCFIHGQGFDDATAAVLQRFRMAQVSLGAESGSNRILREIGKGTTVEQYRKVAAICRRVGFRLHCLWMIGHPGETPGTLEQTISLAREIGDDRGHASLAIPFPGTQFWHQAKTSGEILDWCYTNWDNRHVIFKPHGVTVQHLVEAKQEIGG